MMSLNLVIQDESDVPYSLLTRLIDFLRIRPSETLKKMIVLKNVGFTTEDITLQCIAHPTAQVGLPENTYEAATLSLTESGTYYEKLLVGTKGPDVETNIWIKWAMPPEILPGGAQYAIKARGKVIWT